MDGTNKRKKGVKDEDAKEVIPRRSKCSSEMSVENSTAEFGIPISGYDFHRYSPSIHIIHSYSPQGAL
jgi:hypothetical protein